MPSTRAITALFLLLVAAGHQPTEASVTQVHAAWLLREGAAERSAMQTGHRVGATVAEPAATSVLRRAAPRCRREVMTGDLPAPRAPDA